MKYQKENPNCKIISGNIDKLIEPIEEGAEWIYPINKRIYNELGSERISFVKELESKITVEMEILEPNI